VVSDAGLVAAREEGQTVYREVRGIGAPPLLRKIQDLSPSCDTSGSAQCSLLDNPVTLSPLFKNLNEFNA
jgi:hypothetical protein